MAPRNPQDPGDRRNPWTRPGSLAAAALLGAIVILAIILIATSGGGTNHHTQTQANNPTTSTSASRGSTTTTAANPTACTLPAGSQAIPSASPPAGTSWQQVGSMATPQAPNTLGPQRTSGIWNYCFAHSPSGALLAAFNFWAEGTAADATEVIHHLATGPIPSSALGTDRLDSGGPIQFQGYRYESYSGSQAVVDVAMKGPQGKLGAVLTTMKWTGTDWRYAVPSSGTPALTSIPDLTGYVAWSSF